MGHDAGFAPGRELDSAEDRSADLAVAESVLVQVERWRLVLDDGSGSSPVLEELCGVVDVVAGRGFDVGDLVWAGGLEPGSLGGVDDVVGRTEDGAPITDDVGVVAEASEGLDVDHQLESLRWGEGTGPRSQAGTGDRFG